MQHIHCSRRIFQVTNPPSSPFGHLTFPAAECNYHSVYLKKEERCGNQILCQFPGQSSLPSSECVCRHGRSWEQKPRTPSVLPSPALPHPRKTVQTKVFNCMKSKSIRQLMGSRSVLNCSEGKGFPWSSLDRGFGVTQRFYSYVRLGTTAPILLFPFNLAFRLPLFQQSWFSPCKCAFCFSVPEIFFNCSLSVWDLGLWEGSDAGDRAWATWESSALLQIPWITLAEHGRDEFIIWILGRG